MWAVFLIVNGLRYKFLQGGKIGDGPVIKEVVLELLVGRFDHGV